MLHIGPRLTTVGALGLSNGHLDMWKSGFLYIHAGHPAHMLQASCSVIRLSLSHHHYLLAAPATVQAKFSSATKSYHTANHHSKRLV